MEIGINVFVFPCFCGVFGLPPAALTPSLSQLNSVADIHFNQLFHPQVTCSVQFITLPHKPCEIYAQAYCSSVLPALLPVKCCLQCQ